MRLFPRRKPPHIWVPLEGTEHARFMYCARCNSVVGTPVGQVFVTVETATCSA